MKEKKKTKLYDFSLFYLDRENKEYIKLNESTINDLGLPQVCEMIVLEDDEREFLLNKMTYMSTSYKDVIYRQEIFSDLYKNEEFVEKMSEAMLSLKTLSDLQKYRVKQPEKKKNLWVMINYLKELEVYIEAIEAVMNSFKCCQVQSVGLKRLKEMVEFIYNDSGFNILKEDIRNITDDISKIKSLTLGVNLDENLNPTEVIMTSINEERVSENTSVMSGFMEFVRKSAALNNGDFGMVYGMNKAPLTDKDTIMLDIKVKI